MSNPQKPRARVMSKITAFRTRNLLSTRFTASLRFITPLRPWLVRRFIADLQDLSDAIRGTELDGHYWVWSGLLLGWARDGAVLPHDCLDADFGVVDCDFNRLVDAVPAIVRAGFRCDRCFVNSTGEITELTFIRHGIRFEFFLMFPAAGRLRYYMYKIMLKRVIELQASLPDQDSEPFSFLGRTWLKHKDHQLELSTMYGAWKIPDPSWAYLESLDIEARRVLPYSNFDWRYGSAFLTGDLRKDPSVPESTLCSDQDAL
jgi:hypothetical protein